MAPAIARLAMIVPCLIPVLVFIGSSRLTPWVQGGFMVMRMQAPSQKDLATSQGGLSVMSAQAPSQKDLVTSKQAPDSSSIGAQGGARLSLPGRQIYIDFGANWCNTLRLYQDIVKHGVDASKPWEVYTFEASPLIQPYIEKFVDYLNGHGPRPPLTVPPSGATAHLRMYAARYGCGGLNDSAMRTCMFKVFAEPLSDLVPNPELNNSLLVRERLAMAGCPAQTDRFVFVPSAAADFTGVLDLGKVEASQMIRGGAVSQGGKYKVHMAKVQSANVAHWMLKHFKQEDLLVVKMDIEGAEFGILREILSKSPCLIDVLALECHRNAGNCIQLDQSLRQPGCIQILYEGKDYHGWDHLSTPSNYYPVDPPRQS